MHYPITGHPTMLDRWRTRQLDNAADYFDRLDRQPAPEAVTKSMPADVHRNSNLRMVLSGGAPGMWASNHYAESQHCTGWNFVAAHAFALQFAGAKVTAYRRKQTKPNRSPLPDNHIDRLKARLDRLLNPEAFRTKSIQSDHDTGDVEDRLPLDEEHPMVRLLRRPNPDQSGAQFRYQAAQQIALTGGTIIWTLRDRRTRYDRRGTPREQYVIPTGLAYPQPASVKYPGGWYRVLPIASYGLNLDPDGFGPPGAMGNLMAAGGEIDKRDTRAIGWPHPLYVGDWLSALAAGAVQIDLAEEIDRAIVARFRNEGRPGLVFGWESVDIWAAVPQPEKDAFRSDVRARNAGTHNTGNDLMLPPGMKADSHDANPREMDFAGSRPQARDGVLALHQTPPTVAGVSDAASYGGLFASLKQYVELKVQPNLDLFAEEEGEEICPAYGPGFSIQAKARSIEDPTLHAQRMERLQSRGLATVNEARALEGMGPHPDKEYGALPAGTTWVQWQQMKQQQEQAKQQAAQQSKPAQPSLGEMIGDTRTNHAAGTDKPPESTDTRTGTRNQMLDAPPGRVDVMGKSLEIKTKTSNGTERLLDVPDIKQPNSFSCGAASSFAVGAYFGVGPDNIKEWERNLGTLREHSTQPKSIVNYLRLVGLQVEEQYGMTIDDLVSCWQAGKPVIAPIQDYGPFKGLAASYNYGHYVVIIGCSLGMVFIQDPYKDTAVAKTEMDDTPGRVMIPVERFLEVWHDVDLHGKKYIRYGIIVGPKDPDADQTKPGNPIVEKGFDGDKPPRKHATTQIEIPEPYRQQILDISAQIPDSDLAEDGREDNPHITILHGLHADTPGQVLDAVRGFGPAQIGLGSASLFRNPDADVLKIDVLGDDVRRLNQALRDAIPYTQTHPEYIPHATVAYLKPGMGEKWLAAASALAGVQFTASSLIFSDTQRTRSVVPFARTSTEPVAKGFEEGKHPRDEHGRWSGDRHDPQHAESVKQSLAKIAEHKPLQQAAAAVHQIGNLFDDANPSEIKERLHLLPNAQRMAKASIERILEPHADAAAKELAEKVGIKPERAAKLMQRVVSRMASDMVSRREEVREWLSKWRESGQRPESHPTGVQHVGDIVAALHTAMADAMTGNTGASLLHRDDDSIRHDVAAIVEHHLLGHALEPGARESLVKPFDKDADGRVRWTPGFRATTGENAPRFGTSGKAINDLVEKGFDESQHPRDKNGKFVSASEIAAAANDPAKRKELADSLTPENKKKLDAAIAAHQGSKPASDHEASALKTKEETQGKPADVPVEHPKKPATWNSTTDIAEHGKKMAVAHESDPHIVALKEKHAKAQEAHQEVLQKIKAAAGNPEKLASLAQEAADAKNHLDRASEALSHESRRSMLLSFGLKLDEEARVNASTGPSTSHAAQNWHKANLYLEQIMAKESVGYQRINVRATKGRAYYDSVSTIHTAPTDDPSISCHEFGHHLEQMPWVRERVKEFRDKRFDPKEDVPMRSVAPEAGYGKDETGNPDKMLDTFKGDQNSAAYAGKIYSNGATEIVSMGMEMLYKDPVHFAKTDPEYFGLIVGILQHGKGR